MPTVNDLEGVDVQAVGKCGYTRTEYDNLTGYVSGEYASEWQDNDGTRWRTVVTVINLGKPDRGIAVDPDALMTPEILAFEESDRTREYSPTVTANANKRHSEAMERFVAHMQAHGPVPVNELVPLAKWKSHVSVREHLSMFPETYRYFPGKLGLWGLHGQEGPEAREVTIVQ